MKKIKLFVMDVDGTLTDGKINIGQFGELFKSFNVRDGLGIKNLHKNNIVPIIITGRKSNILIERAKELNINELHQGIEIKIDILMQISKKYNCHLDEIAYIGDDENDLQCMLNCGLSGCPMDAIDSVKKIVNFVSTKKSGEGAVREFIDYILLNNL